MTRVAPADGEVTVVEAMYDAGHTHDDLMRTLREEMRLEMIAAKDALRRELRLELGLTPEVQKHTRPENEEHLRPEVQKHTRPEKEEQLSTTAARFRRTAAPAGPQSSADGDSEEIKLETSLWMMPLFVGTGAFGTGASALLAVLLVVNIAVQYVFAYIVADTMIQPFDPSYVDELLSWRRTTAHDATYYNPLKRKNLAMRVCSNDYSLIYSSGQRDLYNDLLSYLGKNGDGTIEGGAQGPTMCALSLFAFLLVISREVNATMRVGAAVLALPRGGPTVVNLGEGGELSFERLSCAQLVCFLVAMATRLGVCVMLTIHGSWFLVHTISISDLLLNAVALEFVLNLDELIFEALAPSRVLRLVDGAKPLRVPRACERHWRGFDLRAALTLVAVGGVLCIFILGGLLPNVDTLIAASDALCGGDTEFVTTVDGAGVPAWAYPDAADPSVLARRGFPFGEPASVAAARELAHPSGAKFFSERIFDVVAQQFGKDAHQLTSAGEDACGADVCSYWVDGIHQPKNVSPGCCWAKKVKVPAVEAGIFSILNKAAESTEDAVRLWNPSCTDSTRCGDRTLGPAASPRTLRA